jgi:hypothetical protein
MNPRATFSEFWAHFERNHKSEILLRDNADVRKAIAKQTRNYHRECVKSSPDSGGCDRALYFGDIARYIENHSLDYHRLKEMKFAPRPMMGEEELAPLARVLQTAGVLRPVVLHPGAEQRGLIVLDADEASEDPRWRELVSAPETQHRTGPDPRKRTIIVTTLSLLSNLCWAMRCDWRISASIDGTHKMSTSKYILHAFGVNGVGE